MNKAEIQNLVKELSAYDSNYDNYIMTEQDISILADELLAKINYTRCCESDSEQLKVLGEHIAEQFDHKAEDVIEQLEWKFKNL